jgi:hypothetical protein
MGPVPKATPIHPQRRQDVRGIREHPLVLKSIPIYGYVYDVRTGPLNRAAWPPSPIRKTNAFEKPESGLCFRSVQPK